MNDECMELFNGCPSMLRMALAMDVIEGELDGATGFPSLRAVAKHCLTGSPISDAEVATCSESLDEWIGTQQVLQFESFEVMTELEDVMPIDDLDNMPIWPWTEWGKTLKYPWSECLGGAIKEARLYLDAEKTK